MLQRPRHGNRGPSREEQRLTVQHPLQPLKIFVDKLRWRFAGVSPRLPPRLPLAELGLVVVPTPIAASAEGQAVIELLRLLVLQLIQHPLQGLEEGLRQHPRVALTRRLRSLTTRRR